MSHNELSYILEFNITKKEVDDSKKKRYKNIIDRNKKTIDCYLRKI